MTPHSGSQPPRGRFLKGVVAGVLLVFGAAFVYLWMGWAPAATTDSPFPFERRIASMALRARIKKQPLASPDLPVTEANLMDGAKVYRDLCAVCHGIGSEPKSSTARGMYPPPQLMHGKGVTDDPPGETYWKVSNGIRLTGMPAYQGSLTDTQLWQVSLLLANADKLPATVSAYLTNPAAR
jgi:mono/diheme cytochrome c family protein